MNYKKHYDKLIEKHGHSIKPKFYCEKHHILPRCLGGDNSSKNLVYLSARAHYIAHLLLCKIYDNPKLSYALWMMINSVANSFQKSRFTPSSKLYEIAKKIAVVNISNHMTGKSKSESHKKNMSISASKRDPKTRKIPKNIGKTHPKYGTGVKLKITSPDGTVYEPEALYTWAKDKGLNSSHLISVAKGERKHHKSYIAEFVT